ncbi:MAG TPA: ATP-binding protein [Polyangiaceae bacterium]
MTKLGEEASPRGPASGRQRAADPHARPASSDPCAGRASAENRAETQRVQGDLRASEDRLRLLIEHTPAAVAMVDLEMRYSAVSRRWLQDYRLANQNIVGQVHYQVFPELPERWKAVYERCLAGATEKCEEDAFMRTDGSMEWVRWEVCPWYDSSGAIGGLLLFTEVITERKDSEQALRDSFEQAKTARAEAEAARAQAESANRLKDEFLALLGHELRNPLAPILTALQLMKMRDSQASMRERTIIERQVQHLVRMVDDLLDVSRITRGKIDLKREPVEIANIITQGIEMASPLLEQRSHNLRVSVPRRGLLIEADQVRMAQVVANLLTNAAKYTDPGGLISISASRDKDQIVVRVADSGSGIAPDMLPHVFKMFVQGERTLDRAQGGLGIGLTLVRNLVELHGGSVTAHSEGLGKGSEFVLRVPVVPQQQLELSLQASDAGAARTMARAHPQGKRVLVVDDNADAAETLADLLHGLGHTTSVAHDGPTALSKAEAFRPQVALLDIGLPVMDGYELARRLREQPGLQRLRLFAITGYGQESDRERSRAAGFHEHLVKPVDFSKLAALIEESRATHG